jgi:hypothetical protein
MTNTPETDNLARGNHVVPTELAQQLERERDEARKKIEAIVKWSVALANLVDNLRAELTAITEQRDRLAEALEYILGIGLTEKTKAKADKALKNND